MKLKVTKDLCEIKENEIWNVGDYNVHTVQVELSPEFNGLVNKVRYFVEDNSYDMLITDNVAQVPYEATVMEGTIKIGVYGYDADTDILVQSTSPVNKYITSGTYTGDPDNTQPLTPTDKEQMETAIQKNTNDITDLKENKQDKLISGINIKTINNESILSSGNITLVAEETDPIFTNSPAYSITDNDIIYWNNKANISDIPDVSNFITKDVDNLTYYTKSTDMQTAINNAVGLERTARENADNSLQNQIDAITVSSDVVDVVSTYQDLVDYDTQHIKANDIIKVMQDSTHDNAISYYRWVIVNHVGSWVYVGSEGPYYTKSETDTLLNAKQNSITTTNKLQSDLVDDTNQTNLFVTSEEKTTWNNKLDQSDLTNYVKNTDYATTNVAGVLKPSSALLVNSSNGNAYCEEKTYQQYQSSDGTAFISKGTLENVITGKNLETANNKVTSISSSSTDVQYPSAKCVYDNDVIIKDDVNTKYDYLFSLTNLFGKITGTGTSVTLNDTSNTIMKLNLDTTTSSQEGTPSPSNPQTIHTISGNNVITISNSDNTKSQTYPINLGDIELCKIGDYQDSIVKDNGKWYLNKQIGKVVLDGSENWVLNSSSGDSYRYWLKDTTSSLAFTDIFTNIISGGEATLVGKLLCNYFTQKIFGQTYIGAFSINVGTSNNQWFLLNVSETSLENFKNWLSSHNTTVYYVLATPTYILLNDTLQTQLNNIQYALAYDTQTNISQTNNDLPFIINAETYKEINLADYVKNTDYASSSTGGVIKTGNYFQVNSSGQTYVDTINYSAYQSVSNATFISKGTLENVITGKNLETSNNKVTSISSSSTNTEYPSAKAVYDYIQSLNGDEVNY